MRHAAGMVVVIALGACQVIYDTPDGDPIDAPPTPLCTANLCEAFDGPLATTWIDASNAATATVDVSRPHHGPGSLHIQVDGFHTPTVDYPGGALVRSTGLPPSGGYVYARAYLFLPQTAPDVFLQILDMSEDISAVVGVAFSSSHNGYVENNDYGDGMFPISGTEKLPRERWTCLQFQAPSGLPGTTQLYVDGSNAGVDSTVTSDHFSIAAFSLGVTLGTGDHDVAAFDAWLDDLIVDDKPTSCDE